MLFEHLDMIKLLAYERYQDFSADDFAMIIEESFKVGKEVGEGCVAGLKAAGYVKKRMRGK